MKISTFTADWCKPSQDFLRDLRTIEADLPDGIVIAQDGMFDADEDPEDLKAHNVKTLPTFVIKDDDDEIVSNWTGYDSRRNFLNWIEEHVQD